MSEDGHVCGFRSDHSGGLVVIVLHALSIVDRDLVLNVARIRHRLAISGSRVAISADLRRVLASSGEGADDFDQGLIQGILLRASLLFTNVMVVRSH